MTCALLLISSKTSSAWTSYLGTKQWHPRFRVGDVLLRAAGVVITDRPAMSVAWEALGSERRAVAHGKATHLGDDNRLPRVVRRALF